MVIGTCPMAPEDLRRIHSEAGVSGVLSLQHDDCLAYWGIDYAVMHRSGTELGFMMKRCPIHDFNVPDMRKRMPAAILMLANMLARGYRVYVHCTAGMGRAPTVVLGYLTMVKGYSPDDAIHLILKGRPESLPTWEAYYGCREDLVARHRKTIEQRAYELYESGVHSNTHADWYQAQTEILRTILTQETIE